MLLPGLFCDARIWTAQITALSRDRVVSVAPMANGERIEEIASDTLSALPARFALAGVDFGGMVALEMLRRAPDRITRVALIATSPLAETPTEAAAREPRIVAARSGRFEDVIGQEIRQQDLAPGPHRAEVIAKIAAMARATGPEAYVRQARAMQRRKDQQATLRKIKQPALVVCGAHDQILPVRRHEFMAELIPYARLEVLEDAGRLPTLEQPAAMTDLLRAWMTQPLVLR